MSNTTILRKDDIKFLHLVAFYYVLFLAGSSGSLFILIFHYNSDEGYGLLIRQRNESHHSRMHMETQLLKGHCNK